MNKENNTTEYVEQTEKPVSKKELKYAEALENFNQRETPELKQKKHKWLMPLVLIVSIGIGLFLIIQMSQKMGDQKSFSEVFSSVLPINLVWVLLVLFGILVLEVCKYVIALQATTGKIHPLIGAKTAMIGRYYDNITPFAVGGQPMQIYYLHRKGFGGGLSSAVVLIKYFFNTSVWTLVALIFMACNTSVLANVSNGIVIAIVGWIGLFLNMSLPLFILFFVIMPKFATKVTSGVIWLGHKLHIVKDKDKVMKRALNVVRDFRSSFIIMAKSPLQLVLLIFVCVAETVLTFAFPYFIIKMFNGIAPAQQTFETFFHVTALNCYSFFSAAIVPTPGGSGAIEAICTIAFSNIAGDRLLWVIFTWRFATYYIYIIIGVVITIFNFIRNIVRARKAAKAGASTVAEAQQPIVTTEQKTVSAESPKTSAKSDRIVEVEFTSPDKKKDE